MEQPACRVVPVAQEIGEAPPPVGGAEVKTTTGIVLLAISVAIAAAVLNDLSRGPRSGRAAVASAPEVRLPGSPIDVAIKVTVTGGSLPVVQGTTNLPDDTKLLVLVDRPWAPDARQRLAEGLPACVPQCGDWTIKTAVLGGRFRAGPFGEDVVQPDGTRGLRNVRVHMLVFDDEPQPRTVETALGTDGSAMFGPFVQANQTSYGPAKTLCFEAEVDIVGDDQDQVTPIACKRTANEE